MNSELHGLHIDYPLAPEKLEISQNMFSKNCSNIANKYRIKICGVNKLVPNLGNKSKYVVHYRDLQLCLSLEMKVTKTHRVLKLKQSDWLKKLSILIQIKEKMQPIILKKTFSNWWSTVFLVKQWKI